LRIADSDMTPIANTIGARKSHKIARNPSQAT
jgi:hypothetical protein